MSDKPAATTQEGTMSIRELQALAYKQSADKGFHDNEPTDGPALLMLNAQRIALMHSELSEALEELRNGKAANETYYPRHIPGCEQADHKVYGMPGDAPACTCIAKPEGVPSEMADVVIRALDFCGANDIDLESIITEKLAYNATRAHKHGGKTF